MHDHTPVLQHHHHSESFFQPTLPIKVYSFLPFISIQHTPWQSSYLYSPLFPPFIPRPSLTSLHSKVSPALAIFGHWSIQPHGTESPAAKWQNESFAARIWWGDDGKTWRSWKLLEKVWPVVRETVVPLSSHTSHVHMGFFNWCVLYEPTHILLQIMCFNFKEHSCRNIPLSGVLD